MLGRAVLRSRLSQVVGLLPSELAIGTGPHGKPGLISDPAVQFNLSHGGDWLVVALSIRHSLGVDLEPIQPRRNLPGLCRRYLSDREAHTVLAQPSRYQAEHFLRHCTCKEAYVKGLGIGLTQTLTTLDLTPSDRPLPPHPTPHPGPGASPWMAALPVAADSGLCSCDRHSSTNPAAADHPTQHP